MPADHALATASDSDCALLPIRATSIRYPQHVRRSDRLSSMIETLVSSASLDVPELARRFGVSASTIRRDLGALERDHLLTRTRGGAELRSSVADLPLRFKVAHRAAEKRRIAAAATGLVGVARIIGMTGGTTTREFARLLSGRDDIAVVTNALNIAVELAAAGTATVFACGGEVRSSSLEAVGPAAEDDLTRYHVDLAVLGVDGISAAAGCTTYDQLGARTTAALVRQAARVVVLADGSKVGKVALASACPLDRLTVLVTDDLAPAEDLQRIRSAGVDVVTA